MAEQDDTRIAALEGRLSDADRLARAEARLAAHEATFAERERAETQAQSERVLAARAIKEALDEASKTQAENLTAALVAADKIELERVGRVQDKVNEVKAAATLALATTEKASEEYQKSAKETLMQHNGLIDQMTRKEAAYQTKDLALVQRDALVAELAAIHKRLDSGEGRVLGSGDFYARALSTVAAIGAFGVLVVLLIHG